MIDAVEPHESDQSRTPDPQASAPDAAEARRDQWPAARVTNGDAVDPAGATPGRRPAGKAAATPPVESADESAEKPAAPPAATAADAPAAKPAEKPRRRTAGAPAKRRPRAQADEPIPTPACPNCWIAASLTGVCPGCGEQIAG